MSAEPVPVAKVQRMGSYQGVPALGCLLSIEAEKRLKVNDPLYDRATLDAAVAAARAEERERCANVCEDQSQEYEPFTGRPLNLAYQCAAAIRALKPE